MSEGPAPRRAGLWLWVPLAVFAGFFVLVMTGLLIAFDQRSFAVPFFVVALGVVIAVESIRQVPQQMAWVVERMGKYNSVPEPGLNVIVPFLDRVAYRHSLKEIVYRW